MNKLVNYILKGTIVGSTMIATNEVIGYHANPYKSATGVRLSCNIASTAIGYFIGRRVADYCVDAINDVISGYKEEV